MNIYNRIESNWKVLESTSNWITKWHVKNETEAIEVTSAKGDKPRQKQNSAKTLKRKPKIPTHNIKIVVAQHTGKGVWICVCVWGREKESERAYA